LGELFCCFGLCELLLFASLSSHSSRWVFDLGLVAFVTCIMVYWLLFLVGSAAVCLSLPLSPAFWCIGSL
jgi:hypothetical protein